MFDFSHKHYYILRDITVIRMPPNFQGFDRDDSKFQRGRVLTHLMNSDWSGPSFKVSEQ